MRLCIAALLASVVTVTYSQAAAPPTCSEGLGLSAAAKALQSAIAAEEQACLKQLSAAPTTSPTTAPPDTTAAATTHAQTTAAPTTAAPTTAVGTHAATTVAPDSAAASGAWSDPCTKYTQKDDDASKQELQQCRELWQKVHKCVAEKQTTLCTVLGVEGRGCCLDPSTLPSDAGTDWASYCDICTASETAPCQSALSSSLDEFSCSAATLLNYNACTVGDVLCIQKPQGMFRCRAEQDPDQCKFWTADTGPLCCAFSKYSSYCSTCNNLQASSAHTHTPTPPYALVAGAVLLLSAAFS